MSPEYTIICILIVCGFAVCVKIIDSLERRLGGIENALRDLNRLMERVLGKDTSTSDRPEGGSVGSSISTERPRPSSIEIVHTGDRTDTTAH